MTLIPPYLQQGDTIAIVATAKKINRIEVEYAVKTLEEWGYKIRLGQSLFNEYHQFAGTDIDRLHDFQDALDDEIVKAILCARGGYGTIRIIDDLDFTKFTANPKWIMGFSDITVLHSHIHRNFNTATLHSTMPINFSSNTEETLSSLRQGINGTLESYYFNHSEYNKSGTCSGEIVGGNLSILYSLLGSSSDIDTKGKILFIEDLTEYLYHVDRMMIALKRNGKLAHLSGLMVGSFSKMQDNNIPFGKTVEEIILDGVKGYDYPVCFNVPVGHENDNRSLPFGINAKLSVADNKSKLLFLD